MRLPAVVAPMFLVSGPALVQAAREAGLMASFPFPNARTIDVLEGWLRETCAGDGPRAPFAANMLTHSTYGRFDEELALVARYKPDVVITALGGPRRVVDTVHAYGGLVFADVNSVGFARKAIEQGADGLVLVASGAGGHTGSMAGFAFVSAVREFFDGPVMLGGSIGNGRAIRAAEVLGADFAYMGTHFIAARESLADEEYREMLAAAEFEDLILSDKLTGAPAHYLKASLEKMGLLDAAARNGGPDFADSENQVKAWRDVWSAGHGVGSVKEARSVAAIVDELAAQYEQACAVPAHPTQSAARALAG
ncbi:NAD(P)H-dependent flavin oxidoreductase [Marinicauda sp. Alg238-R41]|uniref:NAD(P)H-dependent flavin oxidoreductase n=1 Tax=Marinicauda sp. Alg238-R41 TaxID=2993447 RepID=UPI0022E1F92B|nr:nitronate monooxygenase [Marinicauda sp. Alg238-R41]